MKEDTCLFNVHSLYHCITQYMSHVCLTLTLPFHNKILRSHTQLGNLFRRLSPSCFVYPPSHPCASPSVLPVPSVSVIPVDRTTISNLPSVVSENIHTPSPMEAFCALSPHPQGNSNLVSYFPLKSFSAETPHPLEFPMTLYAWGRGGGWIIYATTQ